MHNMKCYCSKPKKHHTCKYCYLTIHKGCVNPVFDTNLHMIHHYKRVNSAKCVVNTSAPRSYRYKNNSNLNSRYSTPTLLSTSEVVPSRSNSICDVRKRNNCNMTVNERSSSVPPRPCTRRNPNDLPQNYIKTRAPCPKINNNIHTKKIPIPNKSPSSSATNSPKHISKLKPDKIGKPFVPIKAVPLKVPVPAPRHSFTAPKKPAVEDYEYLQFSLRITEDIIRNDLYTQREMRRVFNSHIEANRGRLNMTKMLKQIDHLCKELNISKKNSGNGTSAKNNESGSYCSCKEIVDNDKIKEIVVSESPNSSHSKKSEYLDSSNSSSRSSKEEFLNKVIGGLHVMSEDEINNLTENDLQEIITKIFNDNPELCPLCKKNIQPQDTVELESQNSVKKDEYLSPILSISLGKNTSDNNFDVIHSNVENFSNLSSDNLKTITTCSQESFSVPSKDRIETEPANYNNFENDVEIEQKQLEANKATDDINETSNISIEEILNMVLKNVPEKSDDLDVQNKCNYDLCNPDPICSPKLMKENGNDQPDQNQSSEDTNKNIDLSPSDLQNKEIKSTELNQDKHGSSASEDEILRNNLDEQLAIEERNQLEDLILFEPEQELEYVCSGSPQGSKKEFESNSSSSFDPVRLEQNTPDIQSETAEETKSKVMYSFDSIRTEQNTSVAQTSTNEDNKNKDMFLFDPVTSNLKTEGTEQISDVQPSTNEQHKSEVICCEPAYSARTTNEVSIVAPQTPVDTIDTSAAIKSLNNETTQTSFTAAEKSEPVKLTQSNSGMFYFDNYSSVNKNEETDNVVYDKDNKLNVETVEPNLNRNVGELDERKEKDVIISSITKFILDKTFSSVKQNSNCSAISEKKEESKPKSEEKIDFVSTVEKLINDKTKDLYQYSLPKNRSPSTSIEFPLRISSESLNKYQTEYNKEYNNIPIKNSKRKFSVSSKTSGATLSEGQISSKSSSDSSFAKKINHKLIRKSEPNILEHLKKYEQNITSPRTSNFSKPCVYDYEIKNNELLNYDGYVPKFRRSIFFPTVGTQTSNTNTKFKSGFNNYLLSDGEIQNTSSETDDTKTDFSENDSSSWR